MPETEFDTFLSYNWDDSDLANDLAARLGMTGIKVWLDKEQLVPGDSWMPDLEKALASCRSCVVPVGPHGISVFQKREVDVAITRQIKANGEFRVIPVLLPGSVFEHISGFLAGNQWADLRKSLDDPVQFERLRQTLARPPARISRAPYPGLASFDEADAKVFFGREEVTQELLTRIECGLSQPGPDKPKFLAIVGCSGSGKSSVAKAGVIAAINQGRLGDQSRWRVVACRPLNDPAGNLYREVARALGHQPSAKEIREFEKEMTSDPRTLSRTVPILLGKASPAPRVLIFVDQFEELFSTKIGDESRRGFIDNLANTAGDEAGPCFVMITLRADEFGECLRFTSLEKMWTSGQFLLFQLSEHGLRRAIEEPARMARVTLEEGLTELLLTAVGGDQGSLPILQYMLRELWNQPRNAMTVAAYKSLGGLEGVLKKRADKIFDSFSQSEQQICQMVLLRLVQSLRGGKYTRLRARLDQLYTERYTEKMVRPVLSQLGGDNSRPGEEDARLNSRLLILGADPGTGEPWVEIAHEAVIRSWPKLNQWVTEDREFQSWRGGLQTEIARWTDAKHDRDALLRGAFLIKAQEWRRSRAQDLNAAEAAFIKASSDHRRRQLLVQDALQAGVVVAVLALGTTFYTWQVSQSRKAAAAATMKLVSGTERDALSEALEAAAGWFPTREADEALHEAVQYFRRAAIETDESPVLGMAFSNDGHFVATGSENGIARVWEAETYNQIKTTQSIGHALRSVAFSPDGKVVALAGDDGTLRRWDWRAIEDGTEPPPLGTTQSVVTRLSFTRDGRILASSRDGTIRVWDPASGKAQSSAAGPALQAMALSPGGESIVTGDVEGHVRVWDANTFAPLGEFDGHSRPVTDVSFSSDGTLLASADLDGTCKVSQVSGRKLQLTIAADRPAGVAAVAFSPDGKELATAGLSGIARLWNIGNGKEILALRGRLKDIQLTAISFPPVLQTGSHRQLAVGGQDGQVRIYELNRDLLIKEARDLMARR